MCYDYRDCHSTAVCLRALLRESSGVGMRSYRDGNVGTVACAVHLYEVQRKGCVMKKATETVVDTVERECYVDLTAEEVRAKGEELAHKDLEVVQEEDQLKEYVKTERSRIKGLVLELHRLSETVRQRRELRMVIVEVRDIGDGRVSEVRKDSGEVLRARPMTDAEKQRQLPSIGKGSDAAAT